MDIYGFIESFKYVAIFIGTFIEGPAVGLLVGVFSRLELINPYIGYVVHIAGDMAADSMYYAIGYFGGAKILPKFARYFKFSVEEVEGFEKKFASHSVKLIFFSQITHILGFPILIAAAITRYPWYKFLFWDFIATALKATILFAIGYYFAGLWKDVNNALFIAAMAVLLIILLQVAYFALRRVIKVRNGEITLDEKEVKKLK